MADAPQRTRFDRIDWDRIRAATVAALTVALVGLALVGGWHVLNPPAHTVELVRDDPDGGFPVEDAEAFATRFAAEYLTSPLGERDDHTERISPYLGVAAGTCWEDVGVQSAELAVPAGVTVHSPHAAVVTVSVRVVGAEHLVWQHLQVPVYTDGHGWVVTDCPTPTSAPAAAEAPGHTLGRSDRDTADDLTPTLESFFAAYADGAVTELAYLTVDGARLEGLDGAVTFERLRDVHVTPTGDERRVLATVEWRHPGDGVTTQVYQLSVLRDGGRWYIAPPVGVRPPADTEGDQQ